jgi:hypothetical protein
MFNLTPSQLRLAADLKEKIAGLEKQLAAISGTRAATVTLNPAISAQPAKRKISAAHISKIRQAQKLRWAKHNAAKAKTSIKVVVKPVKKGGMSAEGKARIVAAQKARWAKIKAAKTQAPISKAVVAAKPIPPKTAAKTVAVKPAAVVKPAKKKFVMSAAAKAKISAAAKARWAKIKAGKAAKK